MMSIGHVNAQYNLGILYRYGNGEKVPKDYEQAAYWYTKAAEQGHYLAQEERDNMLEKMSQSQIEEVKKLPKRTLRKVFW